MDSMWQNVNSRNPSWEGQRLLSIKEASSTEFAIFKRTDAFFKKLNVDIFLEIPTPKGAVALKLRQGDVYFNVMLVHAPNFGTSKSTFFRSIERLLVNTTEEAPFALPGDFNCVEYGCDRFPPRPKEASKNELLSLTTSTNSTDAWLMTRTGDDVAFTSRQTTTAANIAQARPWRLDPRILTPEVVDTILGKLPPDQPSKVMNPAYSVVNWLEEKEQLRTFCQGKQRKRITKLNSKIKSSYTKYTRLARAGCPTEVALEELAEAIDSYGSQVRSANFQRWQKTVNKGNPYTLRKAKPREDLVILKALARDADSTPSNELGPIIREFYSQLYAKEKPTSQDRMVPVQALKPTLAGRGLTKSAVKHPEDPVTGAEVWAVITSLPPRKSPGTDELSIEFYRALGIPIAELLAEAINSLLEGEQPPKAFIEDMAVLLFKKGDPTLLRNYRLITLLNVDYKIFTKVFARRLSHAVKPFISHYQNAFIPGRSIGNSVRDVQLTVHHLEQSADAQGILLFLDYEKVYDREPAEGNETSLPQSQIPSIATGEIIQHSNTPYTSIAAPLVLDSDTYKIEILATTSVGIKLHSLPQPVRHGNWVQHLGAPVD
ncbi:LINE-1 retrotransposable element ORF2 protein [Choanephora cucurbitarum]|uniref:LINE-1 retrotransposable element ORF2 protein n=1 Tax=Choanephora cucurbitarum TaxID=101091 RepID=A0A1C7MZ79_9FUNG|nr:LINE-1 retrotransposable element ORF2 protein [Choanephora cucurbitarum]